MNANTRNGLFNIAIAAAVGSAISLHAEHAIADTVPALGGIPLPNNASPLDPGNFRYTLIDNSGVADVLASKLSLVSIGDVLGDANQTALPCLSPLVMLPLPSLSAMFCWDAYDAADSTWYPQGITTTGDAYTEGTYQNETVIVTSWYHKGSEGSRVTLIDYSNPSNAKYRHVLLVEPSPDGNTFSPVRVHAGGIAWYGDLLYVVDTANGFRVFDMRRFLQVQEGAGIGLQANGSYHAYGYKYILPQTYVYQHHTTNSVRRLRHSFISLDRSSTPDSIIVGEFNEQPFTLGSERIIRIAIDSRTRFLGNKFQDPIYSTEVDAEEAYQTRIGQVQGATAIHGQFLLSSSTGAVTGLLSGWYGTLYALTPGEQLTMAYVGHLPVGTEDFSFWPARDQLWTLAEHPDFRAMIALKASAYRQ